MQFIVSKFIGWLLGILSIAMIFVGGWVLQMIGKDSGRWQSFTMFLPGLVLFFAGLLLSRTGRRVVGVYVTSGLFFAFGVIVLFKG